MYINEGSCYNSLDMLGVIKSGMRREPQVIRIEENPLNPEKILFKFCLSKMSDDCEFLGKPEGYDKETLSNRSNSLGRTAEIMYYTKPIISLLSGLALIGISATGIGTSGVIILTAVTVQASSVIDREKSTNHDVMKRIGNTLDPDAKNFMFKLGPNLTIVEFSYMLEQNLHKIDNCRQTRRGRRCKKFIPRM